MFMRWVLIASALIGCACGDEKCPEGTQPVSVGVCHVPGGEAGASVGGRRAEPILIDEEAGSGGTIADEDAGASAGHGGSQSAGAGAAAGSPAGSGGSGAGGSSGAPPAAVGGAGAPSYSPDAGVDAGPTEFCGDGKVTGDELCDGDCPTSCEQDDDPCTLHELVGTGCNVTCRKLVLARESIVCDDDNECTDDKPLASKTQCVYSCSFTGKPAGAVCSGGVCSGALRNVCQSTACVDDSGCTDDRWCSSAGKCELRRPGLCTHDRNCPTGQACKANASGFSECG